MARDRQRPSLTNISGYVGPVTDETPPHEEPDYARMWREPDDTDEGRRTKRSIENSVERIRAFASEQLAPIDEQIARLASLALPSVDGAVQELIDSLQHSGIFDAVTQLQDQIAEAVARIGLPNIDLHKVVEPLLRITSRFENALTFPVALIQPTSDELLITLTIDNLRFPDIRRWARIRSMAALTPGETIQLDQFIWVLGDEIAFGGFGVIHRGVGADGTHVAMKFIDHAPGADRELLLNNVDAPDHVIAVLDVGEHDGRHVLVMPLADQSLADHIGNVAGPMETGEALEILREIAEALVVIDGDLVHRDLKPGNVLSHEGRWKLTDFGASRFADAATATQTHKRTWSWAYCSPERINDVHATIACDVYSLGVVGFQLLMGNLPFQGPGVDDVRHQHLHEDPPPLDGVPPLLAALIVECLYKAPGARPTPQNLLTRLERIATKQAAPNRRSLHDANFQAVKRRAANHRAISQAQTDAEVRAQLATAGTSQWESLLEHVCREVEEDSPAAEVVRSRDGVTITLGSGQLSVRKSEVADFGIMGSLHYLPFDVLLHAKVELAVPPTRSGWRGRSHSFWFCDAFIEGSYQWLELAFTRHALIGGGTASTDPDSARPISEHAGQALGVAMGTHQVAWPLTVLDPDEVTDRWLEWFGDAAGQNLQRPRSMPERTVVRNWRSS